MVNDSIAFFIGLKSRFTVKMLIVLEIFKTPKKLGNCNGLFISYNPLRFHEKNWKESYLAISRRTSPVNVLPATKTLFPASTNSVIPSTFRDPPNSSTVGENRTKWSYKNDPYFFKLILESSALLNVNLNPMSVKDLKNIEWLSLMDKLSSKTSTREFSRPWHRLAVVATTKSIDKSFIFISFLTRNQKWEPVVYYWFYWVTPNSWHVALSQLFTPKHATSQKTYDKS